MLKVVVNCSWSIARGIITSSFVDQLDKQEHLSIRQWRKPSTRCGNWSRCGGCRLICLSWIVHWCSWGKWDRYCILQEDRNARLVHEMKALDRNIWRSRIRARSDCTTCTGTYVMLILFQSSIMQRRRVGLYDVHLQSTNQPINAFDQWCLRHILRIPYRTAYVRNDEVRRRTCSQPPTTLLVTTNQK